jgi:hypothetical protein
VRLLDCPDSNEDKFEETKGVIRSRKSKKDRQYHDQNKKGQKDKLKYNTFTHFTFSLMRIFYIFLYEFQLSQYLQMTTD